MKNIRKRRRLLEQNEVAKDFGGTVPGSLYKYLKNLGDENRETDSYYLWGYQRILSFSKSVELSLPGDLMVVLGIDKNLTSELGKRVFIIYSKKGYPNTLVLVTHDQETKQLEYYDEIQFDVLWK